MVKAHELLFPHDQVGQALILVEDLSAICANQNAHCNSCAVHTARKALLCLPGPAARAFVRRTGTTRMRENRLLFRGDLVEQAQVAVEGLCLVCAELKHPDCGHCGVHVAKRSLASVLVYEVPSAAPRSCGTGGGCGGCGT